MHLSRIRLFSVPWFLVGAALGLGAMLPLAAAVACTTVTQVLWGFDDQPFAALFIGLAVGVGLAVALIGFVSALIADGKTAFAGKILCLVLVAELSALPLGWVGTHYVERVNTRGLLGK